MLEAKIYRSRFSEGEVARARLIWGPICRFLQRYVPANGTTLDLGAGYCHFINLIRSSRKLAVDVNEDGLRRYANAGVECLVSTGADLSAVSSNSVDMVFASNVYEHFSSRAEVAMSFAEVYRVLRCDGRFVILQPNFKYCYKRYFDFFDHCLIFSHEGMAEGLRATGFNIQLTIPRFLPFTTKSRLPQQEWLVSLYLRVPLAWRVFGGQMLLVARKPARSDHPMGGV